MIKDNLNEVRASLKDGVCLVAVSKYHPVEAVEAAYAEGQRIFGESREQELRVKYDTLPKDIQWHFIGHLQTNKVKLQFIIIDEKSGKEKLSAVNYLVQSNTLQNAVKNIEEVMNTGMQDWKLAAMTETALIDVFEHDGMKHVNKVVEDDRPEYEDAMNAELQAEGENVEV